jgi:hypothetical protein
MICRFRQLLVTYSFQQGRVVEKARGEKKQKEEKGPGLKRKEG